MLSQVVCTVFVRSNQINIQKTTQIYICNNMNQNILYTSRHFLIYLFVIYFKHFYFSKPFKNVFCSPYFSPRKYIHMSHFRDIGVSGKNIFQMFCVLSLNLSSDKLLLFTLQPAVVTARMVTMEWLLEFCFVLHPQHP